MLIGELCIIKFYAPSSASQGLGISCGTMTPLQDVEAVIFDSIISMKFHISPLSSILVCATFLIISIFAPPNIHVSIVS